MYQYTADLLCLDSHRSQMAELSPELLAIETPLVVETWDTALQSHPDQALVRYILRGLQQGFRIGFNRAHPLRSARANMDSARHHPEVISDYLSKELAQGRLLGPFPENMVIPGCHINRFGVIPKGHDTGKWRLITDLSFPPDRSVNDGIDAELCSLTYTTVDEVAEMVVQLGTGTLLAKVDIESAYRLIPVHPQDRPLQAVRWENQVFIDPMLPFGLRSAPKIFNAVADALHWCLHNQGIPLIRHYLDDFIILGPPNSLQCQKSLTTLLRVCQELGVPIASQKTEGPTTSLTFLGIRIDTVAGQLSLPEDKLCRLQACLQQWGDRRVCSRRELESLVGLLNHACKVVRAGRSFLRRMIDLIQSGQHRRQAHVPIRLNVGFRCDLAWWQCFCRAWNGVSFLPPSTLLPLQEMASDASGLWGCGAWYCDEWFQIRWDSAAGSLPITMKELIPIVVAGVVWGRKWAGHRVMCHCDNQAIVACLRSRTSKHKGIMHLLRSLVFIEAYFRFHLFPQYIDTRANELADDLSRDNALLFLSKVPQARRRPTAVPSDLLNLLLDPVAEWISPPWRRQFVTIFNRA